MNGNRFEEFDANLRKYLGIPPTVEVVEREDTGIEIDLTFEIEGEDRRFVATAAKITIIQFRGYLHDEENDDELGDFETYSLVHSEKEARELLFDIEEKVPYFGSKAQE